MRIVSGVGRATRGTRARVWGVGVGLSVVSIVLAGPPQNPGDSAAGVCRAAEAAAEADVVVYGGTSGGVVAAIQARRMGLTAILVEPGRHVGGLSSGGLGATDIGNKAAIGGLAREFYRRIGRHYAADTAWIHESREDYQSRRKGSGEEEMWTFEPHVAEQVYRDWLAEHQVPVAFGERLDLGPDGVRKSGNRIAAIRMESGRGFSGRIFIDATYEGDLMAKAGVSYHVGREAESVYGETLNGVRVARAVSHQFTHDVDPFVVPGDPSSGLLPLVSPEPPGVEGAGDHRVQAYNFRMCTTDVPENRLDWPRPEGYDPARYELLLRSFEAGDRRVPWNPVWMPNRKTDTNNNFAISTDFIGANYDYPEADHATRERIVDEHRRYQQGLMHTLATHPRVPEEVRAHFRRLGPARDEFADSGHWPHQLYVREARRMVCDYVMTQHDCQSRRIPDDPVGLGAYNMDSHNCQRYVTPAGFVRNEGDIQVGVSPYRIAWRSIRPRREECGNLLVPVCLAASHIAYGSIRMEPVFMVLGQSAATAAALALRDGCDVQAIDYRSLRERLLADGQVLDWTGPVRREPASVDPATLEGVVVDDTAAARRGAWLESRSIGGFVGAGYLHDDAVGKGEKSVSFRPVLTAAGLYEVRLFYTASGNRSAEVPVIVELPDAPRRFTIDQRKPARGGHAVLGRFELPAGDAAAVTILTEGTEGHVVADAVQFVPVEDGRVETIEAIDAMSADDEAEKAALGPELGLFQGRWRPVEIVNDGDASEPADLEGIAVLFDAEGGFSLSKDGQEQLRGRIAVRPAAEPKEVDFDFTGGDGVDHQLQGIYAFSFPEEEARPAPEPRTPPPGVSAAEAPAVVPQGWRLCLRPGDWRPLAFEAHTGTRAILMRFERAP